MGKFEQTLQQVSEHKWDLNLLKGKDFTFYNDNSKAKQFFDS